MRVLSGPDRAPDREGGGHGGLPDPGTRRDDSETGTAQWCRLRPSARGFFDSFRSSQFPCVSSDGFTHYPRVRDKKHVSFSARHSQQTCGGGLIGILALACVILLALG